MCEDSNGGLMKFHLIWKTESNVIFPVKFKSELKDVPFFFFCLIL